MLHKVIGKTEKSKAKGPKGAINYLTGYSWRHTEPQVLRGNLEVTRELLSHEDKDPYTHGVLSYEENALDVPQDEQDFAMNLIEETLMSGFPPEHYDIVWIRHDDKDFDPVRGSGRLELNYHIVNRDLVTGKKITPYLHKYDMHRVSLAKQIINDRFGYSSPDDPKRARTINLQGYGNELKGAAKELNDFVINGIETEQIDSRDDIIKALQQRDDVEHVEPNKSDTYLVVKLKGASRNLRLKGTIYGKDFTDLDGLQAKQTDDGERFDRQREQRLASNIKELQQLNSIRAEKRSQLIKPKQKRGRKPKANKHGSDAENSQREQKQDNSIDQPNNRIDERVKDNGERFEAPSATTSHDEQRSVSRQPTPDDRTREVSQQMPTNGTGSTNHGNSNRLTFTVLTYIQKSKTEEHDSKKNSNTAIKKIAGTRANDEAENPTIRSDFAAKPSELGSDLGGILRAAIYSADLIRRVIETVRNNLRAVQDNHRIIGSELNTGDELEARNGSERAVTNNYDELNAKCRHLDQLLRGTDPIGLTLTMQQGIKADPTPIVRSTPSRPRFR
ncbi:hypothetical protein D6L30_25045 [Vibrio parahaemolyticus]|nr:hypothetical protein [Vibrio parahaemolyticus]HCE4558380.1 relaxase/mobilization nuclease domain-containing protein [Vibrio parahaemolyticus]